MLTLYIGAAFDPKEVITSPDKTVREIFKENQINLPYGAIVTHNSARLGDNELDKTLAELGVRDEDLITINDKMTGN